MSSTADTALEAMRVESEQRMRAGALNIDEASAYRQLLVFLEVDTEELSRVIALERELHADWQKRESARQRSFEFTDELLAVT